MLFSTRRICDRLVCNESREKESFVAFLVLFSRTGFDLSEAGAL